MALRPTTAALSFLGFAAVWTAGATVAFRYALVVPLVEPLLTALASLATTIGYRLVLTDRVVAAQAAQRRAHEAEMASAAAIQRAMLPGAGQSDFAEGRLDIFAHMIPAREVGGDLYDIVKLDGGRVMVSIGDVRPAKACRHRCSWRSRKPSCRWWSASIRTCRPKSTGPTR